MSWIYLILAGLLEIVWAVAMKQSAGFTRLTPTLLMAAAMPASFFLLALAMRSLPLGTAYMVWTGIGAIGAFAVGVLWLGEPATALRVLAALLIAGGIILMKLSGDGI
ncbi:multidrug efflux SMR transporter [Hyphomonas sp.]|uniref:DMT family transporter n=1 Tax=Hyphomonas sp. TaxID=87 RepID=UPI0025B9D052|nr:multidrug efflux SMR transporter [Hyphomonas sp.]